ncbi:hypothetical protein [Corallococcus sp. 4LFB]|uniref:hypothetical protein n=1 Tax=Corallococcus sp. 4LFB TaxID=3383249 RepID=UPI003974E562
MKPRIAVTADDTDWRMPAGGPGLLLSVPSWGHWRRRPLLHVEATRPYLLRVMLGSQPLFWMRVDDWWNGCAWLRGPAKLADAFPRITAEEARRPPDPGSPGWWAAWNRWWVHQFETSEPSLLHAGNWCLRPLQAVSVAKAQGYSTVPIIGRGLFPEPPCGLDAALRFQPFLAEDWSWAEAGALPQRSGGVMPLRTPSPEDDGRVKAWRKHARDGTLPPVLLMYFALVERWLVVDGHDRLQAALLEGREPPLLGLWSFTEVPVVEDLSTLFRQDGAMKAAELRLRAKPGDVDAVNRGLLRDHEPVRRLAVTRAFPLRGGAATWQAEVTAWRKWSGVEVNPDDWAGFLRGG